MAVAGVVTLAVVGLGALAVGPARSDDLVTSGGPLPSASDSTATVVRTAACVARSGTPSQIETTTDGTPQPVNQDRLSRLAQRVQSYAQQQFRAVFADVELRPDNDALRVYRKPSCALDDWLAAEFPETCVESVTVRYSAVELEEWSTRVSEDADFWRRHDITLNSVGTNPVKGVVEVGTADEDKVAKLLRDRYGPDAPLVSVKGGRLAW